MLNFEQDTYMMYQKTYTLADANLKDNNKEHLPMPADIKEVKLCSDFLLQYHYTKLNQIHFTQPGFFEKFQIALDHNPTYCWTDADREQFLGVWTNIEYAFQKSFDNSLSISAADALVVLLDRFEFDQIAAMDSWILARVFQAHWKEFYQLSFPETFAVETKHTVGILQTA